MSKPTTDTALRWLTYFRNTLADGERVEIEPEDDYTLILDEAAIDIEQGTVSQAQARQLIESEEKHQRRRVAKTVAPQPLEQVEVFVAPFCIRLRPEHARRSGEPAVQHPFWIKATLNRQGQLMPGEDTLPYIPRVFLAPQTSQQQRYVLADVDQVDTVLAGHEAPNTNWPTYWAYVQDVYKELTGQPLATPGH